MTEAFEQTPRPARPLKHRWRDGELVALGGVALSPGQANQLVERGYQGLLRGFDWTLLERGAAAVLDGLRPGSAAGT